jgi:hypothetical protein
MEQERIGARQQVGYILNLLPSPDRLINPRDRGRPVASLFLSLSCARAIPLASAGGSVETTEPRFFFFLLLLPLYASRFAKKPPCP